MVASADKKDSQKDIEAKRRTRCLDPLFLFVSTSLCETACFLAIVEPGPQSGQGKKTFHPWAGDLPFTFSPERS
jgi:hypothetical protein